MSRGHRKKLWTCIGIITLAVTTVLSAAIAFLEVKEKKNSEALLKEAREQLDVYQKNVYVAAQKLPAGTVITKENIRLEVRYNDQAVADFISEEDIGKKVATDVAEGACLMDSMLFFKETDTRKVFVSEAELAEHVENGDRIDVRIRYGNAEDYVVISDHILTKGENSSGMVLELSEEEILLLSSAVADSHKYKQTKLYVVSYPEYQLFGKETATYIPNEEILRMLKTDNTEERIALEQRLEQMK